MSTESGIVLMLVIAVDSGCMAGYVADEKGYNYGTWFLAGLLLNVLALLAVAGLPDRRDETGKKELEAIQRVREKQERERLARGGARRQRSVACNRRSCSPPVRGEVGFVWKSASKGSHKLGTRAKGQNTERAFRRLQIHPAAAGLNLQL